MLMTEWNRLLPRHAHLGGPGGSGEPGDDDARGYDQQHEPQEAGAGNGICRRMEKLAHSEGDFRTLNCRIGRYKFSIFRNFLMQWDSERLPFSEAELNRSNSSKCICLRGRRSLTLDHYVSCPSRPFDL